MDISHGHTFISLFFIVLLFSFYYGLFSCIPYTLCPVSCFLMDYYSTPVALLLCCTVESDLFQLFRFHRKSSFFLGWTAHDTTTLKKVGKRHTISVVIGVFMNHSTSRSPIIQYVVSFRPPASDWILGSVVASVVNLACWSSQLRRLSETLYRMSPSVPMWTEQRSMHWDVRQ